MGCCRKKTNDPKLLAQLANDEDSWVRQAVAKHTDDPEIFAQLANDADHNVREAVAAYTDDPEILAQLANDEGAGVREYVATITNDPEILAQLANDAYWSVRDVVAAKTNDPEILAQLANDEISRVRRTVAFNTDDPELLAQLANDSNQEVSRAAAKKLQKVENKPNTPRKSRKQSPNSDWSIPLYSISDYSQIEGEIDQVIENALKQYGSKYLGSDDVVMNSPDRIYDDGGMIDVTFRTPDGDVSTTIDAESILSPATSQNMKSKCVQSVFKWLEANLDV